MRIIKQKVSIYLFFVCSLKGNLPSFFSLTSVSRLVSVRFIIHRKRERHKKVWGFCFFCKIGGKTWITQHISIFWSCLDTQQHMRRRSLFFVGIQHTFLAHRLEVKFTFFFYHFRNVLLPSDFSSSRSFASLLLTAGMKTWMESCFSCFTGVVSKDFQLSLPNFEYFLMPRWRV